MDAILDGPAVTVVGWTKPCCPPYFQRIKVVGTTQARLCPLDKLGPSPRQILPATNSALSSQTPACWRCRSALPVSSVNTADRGPAIRHAAMAGGVAVAVAGRSGGAGFGQSPVGRRSAAGVWAREQFRIRLGRRANALHRLVGNVHQQPPRIAGIDHRAAEGNRRMRRAPQAAPPRSGRRSRIRQLRSSAAAAIRLSGDLFRRSGQGLASALNSCGQFQAVLAQEGHGLPSSAAMRAARRDS